MASKAVHKGLRTDSSSASSEKIIIRRKRGRPPKLNHCKSDASSVLAVDSTAMASENRSSFSSSSGEAEMMPPKLNHRIHRRQAAPKQIDECTQCRFFRSRSLWIQQQNTGKLPRKTDSVEAEAGKRGRPSRKPDSAADSAEVPRKTVDSGEAIPRKRGRPPKSTRRKLFSSDRSIRFASSVHIAVRVVARRRKGQQQEYKWFPEVTRDALVAMQRLPLRTEPCDFQLPPSWCKRSEKHDPRAPQFLHIKRNVYLIKKPRKKSEDEGMQCSCKLQQCGSNCICRMLYTSCTFDCACDGRCENLPFQKLAGRKLKLAETEGCGWGVFADEDITRADFLIEYVGEVIDDKMCEERLWAMKECGETNFYLCEVSRDVVIDATYKGNISRFINHCCEPNAELRKWECDGEVRIGVFAIASIPKGQQVTYDYQYIQFGTEQQCQCGAASCKGVLGSKLTKKAVEKDHLQEGMLPLTRVFPHRKKTATQPPDGPLPGHRVRVWWPLDQKYYSGRIVHFNAALGKHQILYDDGDKEELTLCKEVWTLEKQE